jgi:hypothetical protein
MAQGGQIGDSTRRHAYPQDASCHRSTRNIGRDPIEEDMARDAMNETLEPSMQAQMYKELAQYVASKKAVEVRS